MLATPSTDSALLSALASRGLRCRWYGAAPAELARVPRPRGVALVQDARRRVEPPPRVRPGRPAVARLVRAPRPSAAGGRSARASRQAASGPVGRHGQARRSCWRRRGARTRAVSAATSTANCTGARRGASPREHHRAPAHPGGQRQRGPAAGELPSAARGAQRPGSAGWCDLPAGSSPLVFPVQATDPAGLLERLRTRRVHGWPLFASRSACGAAPMPSVERSVGPPVHQELAPAELHRMVEAVAPDRSLRRRRSRLEWTDDLGVLRDGWDDLACMGATRLRAGPG